MKAINVLMLDVEGNGKPNVDEHAYDMGFLIINLHHEILCRFRVIISDVFYGETERMQSAYYADKLPQYYEAIANGKVLVMTTLELKLFLRDLCEYFEVTKAAAHNARYDYRATRNIAKLYTKSNTVVPANLEWWDTRKMAHDTICKMPTYRKFCEANGYMTNHKKPRPQEKAETIYRFLTKNTDFVEEHTALADAEIEAEILWKCFDMHKKMTRKLWNT